MIGVINDVLGNYVMISNGCRPGLILVFAICACHFRDPKIMIPMLNDDGNENQKK